MASLERRSFVGMLIAALSNVSRAEFTASSQDRKGIKVGEDEDRFGKSRAIGHNLTTFKVGTTDSEGALFVMEQHSQKPGGPPLHLHREQDEFWYVISGEYVFQIGSERFHARAGDCLFGPRMVPHAYAFVGASTGRILVSFTPAMKIQEYFERPRTPGSYVADQDLYRAYGMELVGPPLPLE